MVDGGGDDRYVMRSWCEGAASYGLGLLIDAGGNDRYGSAGKDAQYVQGFGGTLGIGALIDLGGDDTYRSGASPDSTRSCDRGWRPTWLTLGQGVAAGKRPGEAGGIGLLIDAAGDDTYQAAWGAQGGGAYGGLGALVDLDGHDVYCGAGQARGVDQGIGLLLDAAGDDTYQSESGSGPGSASGVNLGVGMLADASGDDRYRFAAGFAAGYAGARGSSSTWPVRTSIRLRPMPVSRSPCRAPLLDRCAGSFPRGRSSWTLAVGDPSAAGFFNRMIHSRREHQSLVFTPKPLSGRCAHRQQSVAAACPLKGE